MPARPDLAAGAAGRIEDAADAQAGGLLGPRHAAGPLGACAALQTEGLPVHLQPWEDSGHKAGTFSSESRPSSPPADVMEMGLTEMGLIRLRQLTAKAYAPSGYKAFSPLQTRRDCPR